MTSSYRNTENLFSNPVPFCYLSKQYFHGVLNNVCRFLWYEAFGYMQTGDVGVCYWLHNTKILKIPKNTHLATLHSNDSMYINPNGSNSHHFSCCIHTLHSVDCSGCKSHLECLNCRYDLPYDSESLLIFHEDVTDTVLQLISAQKVSGYYKFIHCSLALQRVWLSKFRPLHGD